MWSPGFYYCNRTDMSIDLSSGYVHEFIWLKICLWNCLPDRKSLTAVASFDLIMKIPSPCSPSSFNYSIAACSKHAARFLTCTGDRTHISYPWHVLYPSYWFPRQFCIDCIFIFQCLLVLFSSYFFWALRTLDSSLFTQVIQLGLTCDPLLPLWGLSVIQAGAQIFLSRWLLSQTQSV